MIHLRYSIEKGPTRSSVYLRVSNGYSKFTGTQTGYNITVNTKNILQSPVKCSELRSADNGNNYSINHIDKDEKNFRRLLIEQRELKKKQINIENRLIEIQSDLDVRREDIRRGGLSDNQ